jgi:hypothetical protein
MRAAAIEARIQTYMIDSEAGCAEAAVNYAQIRTH